MKPTEERIVPEWMKPTNGLLLEHVARYYFAAPYVRGRVLDLACGAGYGTQMVAKLRKKEVEEVIGVDRDRDAVEYARRTYYHPLAHYRVADATDPELPEKLGTFDTVLSFETLEHMPDDRFFVRQLERLLRRGGTLVLSTPFGRGRGIPCKDPFHFHQLTPAEFHELFGGFREKTFFYQRGVTFESACREGVRYPFGIAVCRK
ncbi:methyltransferase family protein [Melghirimyces profundicolus]|uniref:Methyltransferase family protein n=1 Tax=Melghirimyces profundicolus TaxID=1242148 RepID=A0A2T6C4K0_9BACL|nr:class I SAM-dependent methyltransferase [Melghirimyces profundicolus]PTX63213.1 methyltransferase family protein [Melghirimyces profundicolus]